MNKDASNEQVQIQAITFVRHKLITYWYFIENIYHAFTISKSYDIEFYRIQEVKHTINTLHYLKHVNKLFVLDAHFSCHY